MTFNDKRTKFGRHLTSDMLMLQLSKLNKSAVQSLVGLGIFVVVLAIVLFVWHERKTSDPLSGLKPGLYQPPSSNSGDTLALPPRR